MVDAAWEKAVGILQRLSDREDGDNELHPESAGCARVAARIHEAVLLA